VDPVKSGVELRVLLADAAEARELFPEALARAGHELPGLRGAADRLSRGERLSLVLRDRAFGFSAAERMLVVCGERSGRLPEALRRLAFDAEVVRERRSRRRAALGRPLAAAVALVPVAFLASADSLPRLSELAAEWSPTLFESSFVLPNLAAAGRMLLALLLVALAAVTVAARAGSPESALAAWASFADALALLLEGGVDFSSARALARRSTGCRSLRKALREAWQRDPHGLRSLLFPVPMPSTGDVTTDTATLVRDLRAAAALARAETDRLAARRDLVLGLSLVGVTGLGLLGLLWLTLGPLLALSRVDPF